MAVKWIKAKSPGVRYHEHESRKHGVRFDRYYSIRYKLNGKDKEEGLGWASQGWNEQKAVERLAELKQNQRNCEGPQTLREKKERAEAQRQAEKEAAEQEKRENLTFANVWKEYHADRPEGTTLEDKRRQKKYDREGQLYKLWIAPVIEKMKIRSIAPVNLDRIKKNMADAGKAPRSIQYTFALIRQVYNFAKRNDYFTGDSPTSKVKWPKIDNGRTRYLTPEQANTLLKALKEKSEDTYGIALLSFQCGLRFGEVARLEWSDVDYDRGLLLIRDAKAGTRHAFLTDHTTEMLKSRKQGKPSDLIFPAKTGGVMPRISPTFYRVVKELGLNEGIDDRRQKLVFHSARHSFGSLLAEQGQDLYTIQKLIGHKTVTMTQRYSHLTENKLKNAIESLGKAFEQKGNVVDFPATIKQIK